MKYNLERPVRFSRDSDHESLYSWSLREMAPSGEKLARDLIPWNWTVRFVASDLRLDSDLWLERTSRDDRTVTVEPRTNAVLRASLWLDAEYSSESGWRGTKLSMFGTEREVSEISLRIVPLKNEERVEQCTLWGCPSYTTDIDFRDHTFPDTLLIQLAIEPVRFRELSDLTRLPNPIALSVALSRVSGLYSHWSPSISTDNIKILTDREAHAVDEEPDGALVLPRLGEVGEFNLSVVRYASVHATKRAAEPDNESLEFDVPSHRSVTTPEADALQKLLRELVTTRRAIASLRAPIWIAVVLLGLMLMFR